MFLVIFRPLLIELHLFVIRKTLIEVGGLENIQYHPGTPIEQSSKPEIYIACMVKVLLMQYISFKSNVLGCKN